MGTVIVLPASHNLCRTNAPPLLPPTSADQIPDTQSNNLLTPSALPPQFAQLAAAAAANPMAAFQRLGLVEQDEAEKEMGTRRVLGVISMFLTFFQSGSFGNMQNSEEVNRTVYVGNISGKVYFIFSLLVILVDNT